MSSIMQLSQLMGTYLYCFSTCARIFHPNKAAIDVKGWSEQQELCFLQFFFVCSHL